MRILVLTERYVPEITAPSVRVAEHARVWLELGHEVTVVTCTPNFPHGRVFPGYRNRFCQEESVDGVPVIRLWSYMAPNEGFFKRTLDYSSYMASVLAFAGRLPDCDVILATSPPLFTAMAGYGVSRFRRRPWVFEVRDLWPASIEAVGASRGVLLRLLEKAELFLYRQADGIVALTNAFRTNLIERGVPKGKIHVVTNGVNPQRLRPGRAIVDARRRLGIPDDVFLAGYIGTTGLAHGLETVIEAAHLCRSDRRICFLIMGEGAARRSLERHARDKGVANVRFADFVSHDEVPGYYAALDLGIVHVKPAPLFRTVIPSKIFEFMAMGVPVAAAVEGEAAHIVTGARCGMCAPPGDAPALARVVRRLAGDHAARRAMGECGLQAVREDFRRDIKARAMLEALDDAIVRFRRRCVHGKSWQKPTAPDRCGRREWVRWDEAGAEPSRRAA